MATQAAVLGVIEPILPGNQSEWTAAGEERRASTAAQREELIVKLIGLVKRVAREMREHLPAQVELDDLVSAGMVGLIQAVRHFDASKLVKIETYARYRIRGAILDALREVDTASRDMRKKTKQAERTFRDLQAKLGRPATDAEMAGALGLSLEQWYALVQDLQTMGIDWMRPTDMESAPLPDSEELPAVNQESQFDQCYREEQRSMLNRALGRMSERERQVLSLYYERDLNMKEIGDQLGIDESRVSQIHAAALKRLRTKVRSMLRPSLSAANFRMIPAQSW